MRSIRDDSSSAKYTIAASQLMDFLSGYEIFLNHLLETGEPTKNKPSEIIFQFGNLLEQLLEFSNNINFIHKLFNEADRPTIADQVRDILKMFPKAARGVLKALFRVCLINDEQPNDAVPISTENAEITMLESIDILKELIKKLDFVYKPQKNEFSVLFKSSSPALLIGVSLNVIPVSLNILKHEYNFRYELTRNYINRFDSLENLITEKFPRITDKDLKDAMKSIISVQSYYEEEATEIKDKVLKMINTYIAKYNQFISSTENKIENFLKKERTKLNDLIEQGADFETTYNCVMNSDLEKQVAKVTNSVQMPFDNDVEQFTFSDNTALGMLTADLDLTIFRIAQVIIRLNNLTFLNYELEKVPLIFLLKICSMNFI